MTTGTTNVFSVDIEDEDHDPVTYSWYGATDSGDTSAGGSGFATFAPTSAGTTVVTVIVRDDRGGSATRSVSVTAKAPDTNRPPTVTLTAAPTGSVAPGTPITLSATGNDADSDAITYSFFASEGVVTVPDAAIPTVARFVAPALPDGASSKDVTVVVVAKDAKGATSTASVEVPVRR